MFSHCMNDQDVSAEFFSLLVGQGITIVTNLSPRTAIVSYAGEWWIIHDNGGELNIEKINIPNTLRSIPYTSTSFVMDTMTMVYRTLRVLKGEDIDWQWCADFGQRIFAT